MPNSQIHTNFRDEFVGFLLSLLTAAVFTSAMSPIFFAAMLLKASIQGPKTLAYTRQRMLKKRLVSLMLTLCLISVEHVVASENENASKDDFGISFNFGGEPYPSKFGIVAQSTFSSRFRVSAGWGLANTDGKTATASGFGFKYFPLVWHGQNGYSLRAIIGPWFSVFSGNGSSLYGFSGDKRVVSGDLGLEIVTASFFQIGLGTMIPLTAGGNPTLYGRISIHVWDF